ncbi:helix-turn-helix domain-containing protein [Marinobacterium arenosum]|uniref:helix-turn-helix domain-containing protein n=1 Tax=Marinobacterium arenosum TaxID=2862496 RepID=UPI001C9474C6|nr:helix-turn-helix transcriptional regulator [Marinobacterium arenosum]MBY4678974.1 helix-turn-helix domain-containing protein [Marinobacterium arenosum]
MSFEHISMFIRGYRQANGESLQALADRSGVSRSMIAQIESGQTSPTIVVLAKLAEAMNIRLGDLVEPPKGSQQVQVVEPSEENIVSKRDSPFVCHQLIAKAPRTPGDFYRFYFRDHGKTAFSANVAGSQKTLWLETGELTIYLANEAITLKESQMVMFNASAPHRFENRAGALATGVFFVTYRD